MIEYFHTGSPISLNMSDAYVKIPMEATIRMYIPIRTEKRNPFFLAFDTEQEITSAVE